MNEQQPQNLKEVWVLCFILGVVMLNYPFLHIFNKDVLLFGMPALVLYFLIGWPVSILVVYLFSRHLENFTPPGGSDEEGTDSE